VHTFLQSQNDSRRGLLERQFLENQVRDEAIDAIGFQPQMIAKTLFLKNHSEDGKRNVRDLTVEILLVGEIGCCGFKLRGRFYLARIFLVQFVLKKAKKRI
jgi:hypothetical protein